MQNDCNLVFQAGGTVAWSSGTAGQAYDTGSCYLEIADGKIRVRDGGLSDATEDVIRFEYPEDSCTSSSDCQAGTYCSGTLGSLQCQPSFVTTDECSFSPQSTDDGCPLDSFCNPYTLQCAEKKQRNFPCAWSQQCLSGMCDMTSGTCMETVENLYTPSTVTSSYSYSGFGWTVVHDKTTDRLAVATTGWQSGKNAFFVYERVEGDENELMLQSTVTLVAQDIRMAMSGNTIAVSSHYQDKVWIYVDSTGLGSWTLQAEITAPELAEVALSGDTLFVQHVVQGGNKVYVYERSGSTWTQRGYLAGSTTDSNEDFGNAMKIVGNTAVIAAWYEGNGRGAVYVFTRNGTSWTQTAKLVDNQRIYMTFFGAALDLSEDESTLVVSTKMDASGTREEFHYIFTRSASGWTQQHRFEGAGGSIDIRDDLIAVGNDGSYPRSAFVLLYTRDAAGTWNFKEEFKSSSQAGLFGHEVAITRTNNNAQIAVSAPGESNYEGRMYTINLGESFV